MMELRQQIDLENFELQRKKISGKWKSIILWLMLNRPLKFNKIKQSQVYTNYFQVIYLKWITFK